MKKEKIQELISRMTLEEKAGMCSGADFWHLKGIERLGIPQVMVTESENRQKKPIILESMRARRQSASRPAVQLHPALTEI